MIKNNFIFKLIHDNKLKNSTGGNLRIALPSFVSLLAMFLLVHLLVLVLGAAQEQPLFPRHKLTATKTSITVGPIQEVWSSDTAGIHNYHNHHNEDLEVRFDSVEIVEIFGPSRPSENSDSVPHHILYSSKLRPDMR